MQNALFRSPQQSPRAPFEFPTLKALSPAELKHLQGSGGATPLLDYLSSEAERQVRLAVGADHLEAGCLLREVSQSLSRDLGSVPPHGGIWVPLIFGAGLSTKTDAGGGFTVGTKIPDLLEPLRAKNAFLRLGAQLFDGVTGQPLYPVAESGTVAAWTGEDPGEDVAQTDPVLKQIKPRPHDLQATGTYSRQLLRQASPNIEAWLRTDMASAHARALDQAAISGPGVENQPVGLLNIASIQAQELGQDGATPTPDALLQLEEAIGKADADVGPLAWISTPTMRRRLKALPVFTGAGSAVWSEADRVLGSPALASRAVPSNLVKGSSTDCHAIILGVFNQAAIVVWGVMEVMVDVFAKKKQNLVEVTSWMAADVIFLRPQSFGAIQDARDIPPV